MQGETTADDDPIAHAIQSGTAYDRVRLQRPTVLSQSIPRKLAWQSGLLGGLALLFPLYVLFPAAMVEHLPSADPAVASPTVLLLGVVGGGLVCVTALVLVATALYRLRAFPLSEAQAERVLTVEDVASYVGFGTGGMAIIVTVGYFLLAVARGEAFAGYLARADGAEPFAASGLGVSVAELSTAAALTAGLLLAAQLSLARRLRHLADE
jgi:hypothetical protein